MNNHERNEFNHWRAQRELRGYLHTDRPTLNAAWYVAGALCAVLILIAMVMT